MDTDYKGEIDMEHLVYCDNAGKKGERLIDKIAQGKKTMVVRGAAGRKIPHSRVEIDETLYFMEKGSKEIALKAKVTAVENYVKLTTEEINELFDKHQQQLQLSDKQRSRWHKKCLCFVSFGQLEPVGPLQFEHQGNMDDWLILEKIEDVLVGTSKQYNYDNARLKK